MWEFLQEHHLFGRARGARNGSTDMIDQSERHGIYDHNGFGQHSSLGKDLKETFGRYYPHATKTGLTDSISCSITDESDQTIYDIHKWTIAPTGGEFCWYSQNLHSILLKSLLRIRQGCFSRALRVVRDTSSPNSSSF